MDEDTLDVPPYRRMFVAFIDILGFRELIHNSSRDREVRRALIEAFDKISGFGESIRQKYSELRFFAFSDSIIVLAQDSAEAASALLSRVQWLYFRLLRYGILSRGVIDFGRAIHTDKYVFGPAIVSAYEKEVALADVPRILVTKAALSKLDELAEAEAVREQLDEALFRDDDGVVYLDPITLLDGFFWENDARKLKLGHSIFITIRGHVRDNLKSRTESPKIFRKYRWVAERLDEFLKRNSSSLPNMKPIRAFSLPMDHLVVRSRSSPSKARKAKVKIILPKRRID